MDKPPLTPTDKNVNDEPPQDRVTMKTDWEWEYEERYGPNEEPTLPWFDRQ